MKKTNLEVEQLIAGILLLGIDKITEVDLTLIIEDFLRKNPNYELKDVNLEYIKEFIKNENDKISLKDGLNLESYIPKNDSNLRKRLQQIAGAQIRKYFKAFDMEEFVLRKINYYSTIDVDYIDNMFCKIEQEELKKLDDEGYLTTYWEEDATYDDTKVIKLSDYGNLKLFKYDNAKEIERFIEELNALRYDVSLLDDFLLKQDLDLPVWSILNIEKLEEFCNEYDRAITIDGVSFVNFERLESDKKIILDEDGKQKIRNMLEVWDEGHCIHICHPNHIFAGAKLLTKDVRNIKNIDWEDIDVQKMFDMNDYGTFIMPDCKDAFKYVHGRLGHQIVNEIKNGNKESAVSYLAIVEKYRFDYENYYLIRGIIKADYKGYSVAINPEYKKAIPQSIWEKQMRFGGNEVPKVYCKSRKNTI